MAGAPQHKYANIDRPTAKTLLIENHAGEVLARLWKTENGDYLSIYNVPGKIQADLSGISSGGYLRISNETGESMVQFHTDDYGKGVVGAFNRKGTGRTLQLEN